MYKSLTAHTSKQGVAIGFDVLGKAMSAMEPLELGRFFAGDPDVVLDRRAQISSSPVPNTESAGVEADEMIALATTALSVCAMHDNQQGRDVAEDLARRVGFFPRRY
ncbi:MAG: hypothetical protein WBA83_13170 [Burkholderiaceae bacterium]